MTKDVYVPVALEPYVIFYNKNLVKTPPTGYQSLLDPSLKGKIGTTQILNSATVVAWYQWLNATYGSDYVTKLSANKPKLYPGAGGVAQAVASGEVAYGAFGNASSGAPLLDAGAPLGMVNPKPAQGTPYYAAIAQWAKHPAAAQVLMDYLMSAEFAEVWVKVGLGYLATPLRVKGSQDPSSVTIGDLNMTQAQIDAFTAQFKQLFGGS
jgi:ABC-type Fe3+ transport system substrate-binding protein